MDLDTIGAALRRKLGPLPVWAWSLIGGSVLYFLRAKGYFQGLGSNKVTGETLQPTQQATDAKSPPTVLQPGESAYNPDTGTLTTAPGGGGGGASGNSGDSGGGGGGTTPTDNSDVIQAIEDLTSAVMGGQTTSDKPDSVSPRTHKPTALERAKAAVVKGKIGPKNRARLKGAGYTASQISYHLRRHTALGKPRGKTQKAAQTQKHGASAKKGRVGKASAAGVHTPTANHATPRARSAARVRTPTGGRTVARGKGTSTRAATGTRAGTATPTAAPRARQRPKIPAITRTAPVQHKVSSAQPKAKAPVHTAPPAARASSPPPRTSRAPAPPAKRAVPPKAKPKPPKKGR